MISSSFIFLVYDGVGPRTSATGASALNRKASDGNANPMMSSIPEMDEHQHQQQQHQQQQQQQQHQFFFNNARLRTSSLKRFPNGNNHIHQPCLIMGSSSGRFFNEILEYFPPHKNACIQLLSLLVS